MLKLTRGNLLEAPTEAVVNTVNTVGVMGAGIALQFRQAFPKNYDAYRQAVERGDVRPGSMFVYATGSLTQLKYIINFPTKRHWRAKSRLEDIDASLQDLVAVIRDLRITSVAVPPLGCGNGGLNWADVRPRIESALRAMPDVDVLLFEPAGAPDADRMPVGTERPRMTAGRAALIALARQYVEPGYRLTLLEVQKLSYFLQVAGENLRLTFVKGKFGPYAANLKHALQRMEGHYFRGYGDRSRHSTIRLVEGSEGDAMDFLTAKPETHARLRRVSDLIHGFESPYGLELLATVHWVATHDLLGILDLRSVADAVHSWNERKRATFDMDHIESAWTQLKLQGWI